MNRRPLRSGDGSDRPRAAARGSRRLRSTIAVREAGGAQTLHRKPRRGHAGNSELEGEGENEGKEAMIRIIVKKFLSNMSTMKSF